MIIYVSYSRGTKTKTIQQIDKLGEFSTITPLETNQLRLETKKDIAHTETNKIESLKQRLLEISTVTEKNLRTYVGLTKEEDIIKRIHIFSDIDSTLTHTGVSVLNRNVKSLIQKITEKNCNFYFCTGRSYQDVQKLMKQYHTGEYGIAENGGIIVGIPNGHGRNIDRREPDKLIKHLMSKKIDYRIDPKQKTRKTEYVLLKDSIRERTLKKAIRDSKSKVEYHASKNTYHISNVGVNKGTAIEYLTSSNELDLNPDMDEVIAMGDSDLDIPMFEYADKGYFVGKPNPDLVKKLSRFKGKIKRTSEAPKALAEVYRDLFPYG